MYNYGHCLLPTLAEKFVIVTILDDKIDGKNVTLSLNIKRRFNKMLEK